MKPRIEIRRVSPKVRQSMLAINAYLHQSSLGSRLLPLVQLRTSQINCCAPRPETTARACTRSGCRRRRWQIARDPYRSLCIRPWLMRFCQPARSGYGPHRLQRYKARSLSRTVHLDGWIDLRRWRSILSGPQLPAGARGSIERAGRLRPLACGRVFEMPARDPIIGSGKGLIDSSP